MTESPNPNPKRGGSPNPMDEENHPTQNPTRKAVEREMNEPGNVRGPTSPRPKREPPANE